MNLLKFSNVQLFYFQFEEVGPYVYTFGGQKLNVEFTVTTIKYQGILQTEYNPILTAQQCPTCNETDKVI